MQVTRAAPVMLYGRSMRSIGRLTASGSMCASDETASARLYGRSVRSIGRLTASGGNFGSICIGMQFNICRYNLINIY